MYPVIFDTPAGTLAVGAYRGKLMLCDWINSRHYNSHVNQLKNFDLDRDYTINVISQIKEYFAGNRKYFDVNVAPIGTNFRLKVWTELAGVSYGTTASYSDIAEKIGNKSAARSVANAISQNPISIIIPCHRIIGSTGTLNGYAGGLEAKKILLRLENPVFRV